jgi:hypothetical protein
MFAFFILRLPGIVLYPIYFKTFSVTAPALSALGRRKQPQGRQSHKVRDALWSEDDSELPVPASVERGTRIVHPGVDLHSGLV